MKPKTIIILVFLILIIILIVSGFLISRVYNQAIITNRNLKANLSSGLYSTYNVDITKFGFLPITIEIKKGDTIVWKNQDSIAHSVISDSLEKFDSGKLNPGQNYSRIFNNLTNLNNLTEIEYYCSYHPYTKGKIIIKDEKNKDDDSPENEKPLFLLKDNIFTKFK